MTRDEVNTLCARFPGADHSDPWGGGHDVWKVGGKLFAVMGTVNQGISVKTESIEHAGLLIEMGLATKAPYFHRSWVLLPFDTDPEDLRGRLLDSYCLVRSRLPKKVQ